MALEEILGRAIVELRAPSDKLKRDLDSATGQTDKAISGSLGAAGDKADAVGGKLGGASKMALSLGATLVSAGIATKLKGAADAAGDLSEAVNANSVVFKEGTKDFDAFAKSSLKNLGLAEITVRNLATGVAGMFSAVGFEGIQASKMTQDLITRARDVGSVFNESAEVVTQAFGSALRGEAEPARRFGVFLNADAIAAEALSSGLAKANVDVIKVQAAQIAAEKATKAHSEAVKKYGEDSAQATEANNKRLQAEQAVAKALEGSKVELTDAQKMQAAYNIVMRQTEQAAGDYKNTMNSKANSDQKAKEAAKEASASLGQSLAPILGKVSQLAAGAATAFTKLPGPLQTVVAGLLGIMVLAGPIGSVVTLLGAVGLGGGAAAAGSTAAGTAAAGASGGFKALAGSLWAATAPLLPWIVGIGLVIGAAYLLYRNWDTVTKAVGGAMRWLGEHWRGVVETILTIVLGPLGFVIGKVITHWNAVKDGATTALNWVKDRWHDVTNFIGEKVRQIGNTVSGLWDRIPGPIRSILGGTAKAFIPGLANGGTVAESGFVNVGERGPERLWLPRGAAVEPLSRGQGPSTGVTLNQYIAGSVVTERRLTRTARNGMADINKRNGSVF